MAKMIMIPCICPFCGKTTEIAVDSDALYEYRCCGKLVQDAFPTMTPAERELIKTGMCLECQHNIFDVIPEDEDDWEDDDDDWEEEDDEDWGLPDPEDCFVDDEWGDADIEVGFDPYAGCYSDDC